MSKRTKILITIDWFLPGTNSGGPVRSYANLVEHLKDDFEFLIVTRNTDFGSEVPYETVVPNTWTVFNAYTKVFYLSKETITKNYLKTLYAQTDFDIAYINGIYSWYFSILPVSLIKKLNKPVLVSARGMLNPQAFSVKGLKKRIFLNLAPVFSLYKNVSFHATNEDEANYIKAIIGSSTSVGIAANLPRKTNGNMLTKQVKHTPMRFVNVARISIEKGTLVMLSALKEIHKSLVLDLYGPIYDQGYWEKCQAVISELPKNIVVTYKGVLPSEEIPKTLSTYNAFILLSEGENFGHAILEALSVGLPVIISNRTPWKALESKTIGWDISTKNTSHILKAINAIIEMSDLEYAKWSKAAFEYATDIINNPKVLEQNKALFLNAIKKQ